MKTKIIIILLIIFSLTGCYNYRELDQLGIISAIGIEKENNKLKLTIQVLDTEKGDNSEENTPKYVIYNTSGDTIQEALRNIVYESSKRLYMNHMQVLLFSEDLARDGISDIIDFFLRDPESREQYLVLVAKSNIKDILSTETLLDKNNGKSIKERTITNDKYLGSSEAIRFSEFISDYINPNKQITLPSIEMVEEKEDGSDEKEKKEDTPSKRLFLSKTAIFKEDKLIGYLENDDSKYLKIIKNSLDDTILTTNIDNKNISIEIIESKTKLKVNKSNIDIIINMEGSINDISTSTDLKEPHSISYLQNIFDDMLSNNIKKSIVKTIDKYDSDIYGFKDLIYKSNPKYYNENNIDLKKLNINIKTNIELTSKGTGVDNLNEKN